MQFAEAMGRPCLYEWRQGLLADHQVRRGRNVFKQQTTIKYLVFGGND